MSRRNRKPDCQKPEEATRLVLPAGTPEWITAELIEATIRTWQPYYKKPLTPEDAVEMVRNVGLMYQVLSIDRTTRSTEPSNAEDQKDEI